MTTLSIPLVNTGNTRFYTRNFNGGIMPFDVNDIMPLQYPVFFEGVIYNAIVLLNNGDYNEAYPLLMEYPVGEGMIAKEILWTYYDDYQEELLQKEITPEDIVEFYEQILD